MGHSHAPSAAGRHRRPLLIAFSITAAFMVVEFVAGFATGSLALISDAAHMGTDVIGLGLALTAITLAGRVTTRQRTYGMYRLEVLAALANGLLLIGVAVYVLIEAIKRFQDPPEIPGVPLLVVAVLGLTVNVISFMLLRRGAEESLNLKGASLEVLGDLLGSVGVIVAALILMLTGWPYADPIIGVGIGLFILPRTFLLLRSTLRVLLESAPPEIDVEQVQAAMEEVPGVEAVHDLHVWTITSGMNSATGHLVVLPDASNDDVLEEVLHRLRDRFGIEHATIQCETAARSEGHAASPI